MKNILTAILIIMIIFLGAFDCDNMTIFFGTKIAMLLLLIPANIFIKFEE